MTEPTAAQLIDALGGPATVARLLSVANKKPITPQAVTIWKRNGIPPQRVTELALARGRAIRSSDDIQPENWARLFPELASAKKD